MSLSYEHNITKSCHSPTQQKKEVEEARVKKELLKSMQLSRCYNNLMEERFTLIIKLTPIEL